MFSIDVAWRPHTINSPPVPPNSYWRWPYWDVQNTAFLPRTQVGKASYVKNGLDVYHDVTYTTHSANGRFRSPYDDHAYGADVELGTERCLAN